MLEQLRCAAFTSVLALTLKSGLELEKSMELAKELAENETVAGQIDDCSRRLEEGEKATMTP